LKDEDLYGKNTFTYYPAATDTVMALKAGRVCLDKPVAQLAVNTNEGIATLPEVINKVDYGIIFPKGSGLSGRTDMPPHERQRKGKTVIIGGALLRHKSK